MSDPDAPAPAPDRWERPATQESLGRAFEELRSYLHRMAGRGWNAATSPPVGASDLVQQTYVAARQHIEGFRGQTRGEWRLWLLSILRTQKGRVIRRSGPNSGPLPSSSWPGAPIDPGPRPSRWVTDQERRQGVRRALDRIPVADRAILELRHRDQLRFRTIADRLGDCTVEAARQRYVRALERLKVALGPTHDGS